MRCGLSSSKVSSLQKVLKMKPGRNFIFDNEQNPVEAVPRKRRRRLSELIGGWHCSVLGTCLSQQDLKALARRLSLKIGCEFPEDYQIHGYFAQEAEKSDVPGKLLNKLLDRRHALSIRQLRSISHEEGLSEFWDRAKIEGNIPGPYWAILTHPLAGNALCQRVFADVHMLSHLMGSSNRADIRRLQLLEDENQLLRENNARDKKRHSQRISEKANRISQLENALQIWVTKNSQPWQFVSNSGESDSRAKSVGYVGTSTGLDRAQTKVKALKALLVEREVEIKGLLDTLDGLKAENRSLEEMLAVTGADVQPRATIDLVGRHFLYVGGKPQTVHRLRDMVESRNGVFSHHDGGVEKSIGELVTAIGRADAVTFPTDRVSHEAALTVKRLCRRSNIPYVPLRGSGIGSFFTAIRSNLDWD